MRALFIGFTLFLLSLPLARAQDATPEPTEIYAVAWSPDGTMIAGGGTDGFLRVYDASTQAILFELEGHTNYVVAVAWSSNSDFLASSDYDGIVRIWSINHPSHTTGSIVAEFSTDLGIPMDSLAWSPDEYALVAASSIQGGAGLITMVIWDTTTYQQINAFSTGGIGDIAWHPNNSQIAAADIAGGVYIFDPATDVSNSDFPFLPRHLQIGATDTATGIAWNQNGSQLAVGSTNATTYIIDSSTGSGLSTFYGSDPKSWITRIEWNPIFDNLIAYVNGDLVEVFDLDTQGLTDSYLVNRIMYSIAWSPDGRQLAYGGIGETPNIVEPSAVSDD